MTERVLFGPGGATETKQDAEITALGTITSAIAALISVVSGELDVADAAVLAKLEQVRLAVLAIPAQRALDKLLDSVTAYDAAEDDTLTSVAFGPYTTAGDHVVVPGVPGQRLRLARITTTFDNRSDANPLPTLYMQILTDDGLQGQFGTVLSGRFNLLGAIGEAIHLVLGSAAQGVTGTIFYEVM